MLLPARCDRIATSLNRTVSGYTFPALSSLDKIGKLTEAYAMLNEVYGNECLLRTQVFEWFKRFKVGRETIEDDLRHGRLSTSKTDENIGKLIREDRPLRGSEGLLK
ncbi:hypothetical protein NQ318_018196 [Aromia moschata]|uniref:Mos1 transposase HTH domain-containing protein n=1 Tax=Aromia moschata TaxID=1265417 RepID=A0AAV8ZCW0_9CUCU|nr:hypothetical protein NQ318_018196 [Aromia moschata]